MHLYLIRHAISEWQEGTSQSRDSDTSKLGEEQKLILKKHVRSIIDETNGDYKLFSSPLKRSIQTIEALEYQYNIIDKLKEADFHVASVLPVFDNITLYKQQYVENDQYLIFKSRLCDLLDQFTQNTSPKSIFMFTHAGVIKTLLRIFHDNDAIDYIINNCSVTKISWHRNRWTINYINDTSFLPKNYIT